MKVTGNKSTGSTGGIGFISTPADLFFTEIPDKIDEEDSTRVRKAVQELIDLLSYDSLLFKGGGVIFLPLHRFGIGGWTFRSNSTGEWETGNVCVYMVEEKSGK